MKYQLFGSLAVGVVAVGLLSGCAAYDSFIALFDSDRLAKCPDAQILADAAVLPAFDPQQKVETAGTVYRAAIRTVDYNCSVKKKKNTAKTSITIAFRATRATGGPKAAYRIPYFVASTINGRILDKKMYWQDFAFDEGQSSADFEAEVEALPTQATRRRVPSDYHFIVGFQLTKAQLAYNKRVEPYGP
jgi:hypothetical protein